MATQVGILDHGRLLFEGPLEQLQQHSRGGCRLRTLWPERAFPVLESRGLPARLDQEGRLELPFLPEEALADLVQALAEAGAGVVELQPCTRTLEEIFLSLTGAENGGIQ